MNAFLISIAPWLVATFVGVVFLIQGLRTHAATLNLVDVPGGRKKHRGSVPVIGGIAIFVVFMFAVLTIQMPLRPYAPLLAGISLMAICGVIDDLRELSSGTRLLCQIIAAVFVVSWAGLKVTSLGDVYGQGEVLLGDWSTPFTMLCIVGLINSVNMADGVDGLAGGFALIALGWFAAAGFVAENQSLLFLAALLAAAVAGFLVFNIRHPWRSCASIFLGDAGSMALGFALGYFAVALAAETRFLEPVSIAWILGLPVIDTISLMVRRVLKGKSPFAADRQHLHHVFQRAGYSPAQTAAVLLTVSAIMGAIGFAGSYRGWPEPLMYLGLLAVAAVHFLFINYAWRAAKLLRRRRRRRLQGQ